MARKTTKTNDNIEAEWREAYGEYCEGRLADPYPLFSWLHENLPIHWSEPLESWFICAYDDVVKILLDSRFSSSRADVNTRKLPKEMQVRLHALEEHVSNWLGFMDPPRHTEIRRLLQRFLNPATAQKLEGRVGCLSQELVSKMGERVDVVAEVAHALPLTVISEILGIPIHDRGRFRQTVIDISDYVAEAGPTVVNAAERAHRSVLELQDYFKNLIEERKRNPKGDVVSDIANVLSDEADLTIAEVLGICVFFFAAGHDTSEMLVGSSSLLLLQHPEILAMLQEDRSRITTAVEEFLRYESPVALMSRVTVEDVELAEQGIRKGDAVLLCLAAANRDPVAFPHPNRIVIDRQPNKHLAFGWGGHFCLGAPLARLEARVALTAMLDKLAMSRMENPEPAWHPRQGLRALRELWIVDKR